MGHQGVQRGARTARDDLTQSRDAEGLDFRAVLLRLLGPRPASKAAKRHWAKRTSIFPCTACNAANAGTVASPKRAIQLTEIASAASRRHVARVHSDPSPISSRTASERSLAREVFAAFLSLGLRSFGGPVAHLGYFHAEFVERRRWLINAEFSQLLALAQFLPGPASSQLGFAIGLQRAGWLGGIAAFVGFTLPSVLLMFALAIVGASLGGPWWTGTVHGLKLVAVVVVADSLWKMGRQLTPDAARLGVALLSASIVLWLQSADAQMIALAIGASAGLLISLRPATSPVTGAAARASTIGARGSAVASLAFVLLLSAALALRNTDASLLSLGAAFVRAGSLVFGGGHVVLPLLEESVVASGWMSSDTFLSGYGAAQAVPGPMFSLASFLGALVAWSSAEPSIVTHAVGALVAILAIFAPGLLLVVAALPLWNRISANATAARVIVGVNAAVVGLLGAALYDPVITNGIAGGADVAIVLAGFALHRRLPRPTLWLLLWCVSASLLVRHL